MSEGNNKWSRHPNQPHQDAPPQHPSSSSNPYNRSDSNPSYYYQAEDLDFSDSKSSFWVEAEESFQEKQSYTWQELQQIEVQRRAILQRVELPFWKILTFIDGTCLGVLSRDPLLWLSIALYAIIRIQVHLGVGLPRFVANIGEASNIDILGGFLSFFLVLFVNQSNGRFNEMYKQSTECTRKILDVAGLTGTTLPEAVAGRIVRYLNAAHAAGYVGLSHTYTKRAFFDELNYTLCLLTPAEMAIVDQCDMDHRGDCFREVVNWALMDVQHAEKQKLVDGRAAGMLREKILGFRGAMDSLFDFTDQPIHFFYIHFLSLLTFFYLPVFSISNAYAAGTAEETHWSTDLLSGVIVIVQSIFVIGLRLLGQKMVDPYGDDLEDLSVLHYVRETWKMSNRSLSTTYPAVAAPEVEEEIRFKSATLGQPWDLRRRRRIQREISSRTDSDASSSAGGNNNAAASAAATSASYAGASAMVI